MVGRATALLTLLAALAAYYAASGELPDLSTWPEIAFMGAAVFPAMFGVIGLALPSRQAPLLGLGVVALGALSAILEVSGLDIAANFTKFAAVAGAGWWILRFLDHVALVLLVAVLIVPIDLISVALGPTRTIVEEAPGVFNTFSVSFPIPGEVAFSQLGLPDVLFFALFLAAAEKFRLRPGLAWLLMACSFGGTITLATLLDRSGFAALPLLSAGFVIASTDRLIAVHGRRWFDLSRPPRL